MGHIHHMALTIVGESHTQVVTTGLVTRWLMSSAGLMGKLLGIGLAPLINYFGDRFAAQNPDRGAGARACFCRNLRQCRDDAWEVLSEAG